MNNLEQLSKLVRYYSLTATTHAGSGHPTSSLSATDLMTVLLFGGFFRFDVNAPLMSNNDRLIFSKGHASPLFYALWAVAGAMPSKELMTLRTFGSRLEGHPTMNFPFTEAATGSLGQGLSIGLGMALNAKYLDQLPYRTYVLIGDSEMAEGSQWEALQLAAHYKLDNLIGILDVNRLGQRGATMYGHDIEAYQQRIQAFGWETIVIDGHSLPEITSAFQRCQRTLGRPVMIIAKTLKGKGVSFLEDQDGWHGKALNQEELDRALAELGDVDTTLVGTMTPPEALTPRAIERSESQSVSPISSEKPMATRKAYGLAIANIANTQTNIVVLDAEVSNSTYAQDFQKVHPQRFFEMFIAEQNMVGTALGLSRRGKIPFVSTFATFFSRAFDQIRMCQYSNANIKFVGSHAGVSIGEDGASQMGLEDIALFRAIHGSVVLYPADAQATERLVASAAAHHGITYIRTTRKETTLLYSPTEEFPIGGSKVLRSSDHDVVTIVAAGITVYEALKAYDQLHADGVTVRVIDAYSIKPIDVATLVQAIQATSALITVEDHYPEGGLGEAVSHALSEHSTPIYILAVGKLPKSGKPDELLHYEEIDATAIIHAVHKILP